MPPDLAEVPVNQVPNEILHYLMPTRYCESDLMSRCAQQLFGDLPPGIGRVQAIVDWIHDSITYEPGSSDSTTTAREVFVERAGVCRDFAHLGITFCRALNIPARLVVGYVWFDEPPQDFHAVFEAWLGGQLGAVRRHAHGAGRSAGARGHRPRRQGRGLLHHLRPGAHDGQDRWSCASCRTRACTPPAEPEPSGQLVGIEKPVPVPLPTSRRPRRRCGATDRLLSK